MFDSLFGVELPLYARFFIAFLVVLGLIAGTFWLIRRFSANRMGAGKAGGRQPRLAVIDAAAVDSRRRLVLIRRDNVEHLVMIGGPSDLVIEQNIVRAVPVGPLREPPPPRGPGETVTRGTDMVRPDSMPRPAAATDGSWSPPPLPETIRPRAEMEPRSGVPSRPLPESISPVRPMAEPRAPLARPSAEMQPVEVRQSPPTADVNLADMAQRLEAALRRPGQAAEARPEPPQPQPPRPVQPREPMARPAPPRPALSVERPAPSVEPPPPPMARSPAAPPRVEPPRPPAPTQAAPMPPAEPSPEPPRPEPPEPAGPEPVAAKPPAPKTVFDSLEEEMASLLGRPPDKT